ncbi:hypothetical protein SRHO_G00292500 [Serrasalmus rhombeus]
MLCELGLLGLLLSTLFEGATSCRRELLTTTNITAQLQSDVLLPCYFKPAILGSIKTDIAAVWSHTNITTDNLLEIKLQGEVGFWNNRGGRIKTFPKHSEPGNYSILLRNVQQSDVGLYRCELFRGINCVIAYQNIYLSKASEASIKYWYYLLGVAVVLCLLLVSLGYMQRKRNKRGTQEENVYENAMELRTTSSSSRGCSHDPAQGN